VLLKAEGLLTPLWGSSDPYVVLRVAQLTSVSKKNNETSKRGRGPGDAVWNEGWELEVQNPETAVLIVEVREGNAFCSYGGELPRIVPVKDSELLRSPDKAASKAAAIVEKEQRGMFSKGKLLGTGSLEIKTLIGGKGKKIKVGPLKPHEGTVLLDLSYSAFVDPRPI
jgi:hypothetical protein